MIVKKIKLLIYLQIHTFKFQRRYTNFVLHPTITPK